jgi:hypothetical protein
VVEITHLTDPGLHEIGLDGDCKWKISTKSGRVFYSNLVVNCAGLFGDEIDAMGLNVCGFIFCFVLVAS